MHSLPRAGRVPRVPFWPASAHASGPMWSADRAGCPAGTTRLPSSRPTWPGPARHPVPRGRGLPVIPSHVAGACPSSRPTWPGPARHPVPRGRGLPVIPSHVAGACPSFRPKWPGPARHPVPRGRGPPVIPSQVAGARPSFRPKWPGPAAHTSFRAVRRPQPDGRAARWLVWSAEASSWGAAGAPTPRWWATPAAGGSPPRVPQPRDRRAGPARPARGRRRPHRPQRRRGGR